jgi:hypothetical protein
MGYSVIQFVIAANSMLFLARDESSDFVRTFLYRWQKHPLIEEDCEFNSCYEVNYKWVYIRTFTGT